MNHPAARRIAQALVAVGLLVTTGCQTPPSSERPVGAATGSSPTTMPAVGSPMQDVRTEATIQEMEQWYNATKNSRPTHQAEAEAEAAKKAKARQLEAEKKDAGKGP